MRKFGGAVAPLLVLAGVALLPRSERAVPAGRATSPPTRPPGPGAADTTSAGSGAAADGRGRTARSPLQIPLKGWKDILIRTKDEFGDDNIAMISAGVTFYSLLALFPGMAALIAIYGLFADPSDVQRHVQALAGVLPGGAVDVIGGQLQALAKAPATGLSAGFALGLLASLWSANGAVKALMVGLNVAYDEHERRGVLKRTLISLGFTFGLLAFVIAGLAATGFAAWIGDTVGGPIALLADGLVWLALLAVLTVGLALVYRFGPSRDPPRFEWVSGGSVLAVLVWIAVSVAFTAYVANFGHYNKVYGSLGAAIGFMTWIYLSTMVVLAGAELNAEIEHQTAVDTTQGTPQPQGARGAKMADTLGRAT